jgi:hypothetical protein
VSTDKNTATDAVILQENVAMDTVIKQMPQNKLKEFAGWFLYFAAQKGIISYDTIDIGNTSEMMNEVDHRFQEMKQDEDMVIILESEMKDIQTQSEELLEQKDMECEQVITEKSAEADKTNAKLTQKLRDSGQQCLEIQEEIQWMKFESFSDEIQGMKFESFCRFFLKWWSGFLCSRCETSSTSRTR